MSKVVQRVLSEEVLDKTMNFFWERGYFNTSIDDIVNVTGFNRVAIYKYFGGKEGLFFSMLKRYRTNMTDQFMAPLQNEKNGIEGIRKFFNQLVEFYDLTKMPHGCFLIATASDLPSHNPEIAEFVKEFLKDLRQLFFNILQSAKDDRKIKQDRDIYSVADFLVGNVFGLFTLCRSSAPKTVFENHVRGIMDYLSTISITRQSKKTTSTTKRSLVHE